MYIAKRYFTALPLLLWLTGCTSDKGDLPAPPDYCDSMTVSYTGDIKPIIDSACVSCHVSGGPGSGDFTTYEGLKAKVDNKSLKARAVDSKDMPMGGPALPDSSVRKLNCWIKAGGLKN